MLRMNCTRRQLLAGLSVAALGRRLPAAGTPDKPMRGVFIIMATPYTESDAVDYEDLAREVDFLDRCGVQGMVWPQLASEYVRLTKEERLRGMEVIGKAAKGKKPALVLGVQGSNKAAALAYLEKAESVSPDAIIAIPPTEAKSLDDFREYYRALARATRRPLFIQTTGGAKAVVPTTELLVDLAKEFPNCGYVKEEQTPVIERMQALASHRPAIKSIFSGAAGKGMLYEMRMGFDGTMPGAPYSDIYAQIWNLYQSGRRDQARDLFGRLLVLINMETQAPGTRQYIMKKRGVFKTTMSRQKEGRLPPAAIAEIDFNFEGLRPYLKA
jgi:dihydrodipicolinate synthase/N-acetylneuraminate lyase